MSFEPQNAFEETLIKAATDPAERPQFYRELLEAEVLIVRGGPPTGETGETTLTEGMQLEIQQLDINGAPHIPFFSSLPRLESVLSFEAQYLGIKARDLFVMTRGEALVLNPGSDYGKQFSAEEIAALLDGSLFDSGEEQRVRKPTEVRIGAPAEYPTELVDSLTRFCAATHQIRRAYVAHYHNPEDGHPPHTLIAMEVTAGWDGIAADAGLVAQQCTVPHPPVDFVRFTGRGDLDSYFAENCEPFYQDEGSKLT